MAVRDSYGRSVFADTRWRSWKMRLRSTTLVMFSRPRATSNQCLAVWSILSESALFTTMRAIWSSSDISCFVSSSLASIVEDCFRYFTRVNSSGIGPHGAQEAVDRLKKLVLCCVGLPLETHLLCRPIVIQSHRIRPILRIVVTIPEQIVISRIEAFRVFTHEAAQAGMISTGAVFVEAEGHSLLRSGPFSSGKHEPIVDGGEWLAVGVLVNVAAAVADGGRAKTIVAVLLDQLVILVAHVGHTPFVVLVEEILFPTLLKADDKLVHADAPVIGGNAAAG